MLPRFTLLDTVCCDEEVIDDDDAGADAEDDGDADSDNSDDCDDDDDDDDGGGARDGDDDEEARVADDGWMGDDGTCSYSSTARRSKSAFTRSVSVRCAAMIRSRN